MNRLSATKTVLIALSFATLLVFTAIPNSAQALSSMTTQEINIHVLEPETVPTPENLNVPGTGVNTAAKTIDPVAAATSSYESMIITLTIITTISTIILARKHKKITKTIPVLAICIISPLLSVETSIYAATGDPTIQLEQETLDYSLRANETAYLDFSILATTSSHSVGYTISNLSDNTNEDIILDITGGSYTDYSEIPSIETDDPLMIHYAPLNASSGDTSQYKIAASVSDAITPGTYKILLTYFIDTDEGEFFRFSIDTRLTDTLDADTNHLAATATTFAIPTSGYINQDETHKYNWLIDWGDSSVFETTNGVSDDLSTGIPHTYATPGSYQITIWPNGLASAGWLNAFGFYNTNAGANTQANKNMFYSIDTSVTDSMRTYGATYRFAYMFFGAKNAIDLPPYLFDSIYTSSSSSTSNMFNSTFSGYATNSTSASIPSELFGTVDTSFASDVSGMFTATFFNFANNSTSASIPSGLFSTINTAAATNTSNLFRDTFFGHAAASTSATIPADLFSSIHIADGANASDMFGGTFYFYAGSSTSGTIPDGLFATIDTTNAGNITGMFSGTFSGYARSSSTGTIPANLFATIDTSKQQNLTYLFNGTFSSYAFFSNTTIPIGLFDTINTASATNLSSIFAGTFSSFANNSPSATIPAGLFSHLDMAKTTNAASMFRDTFSNYAGLSTIATIPASLFDSVTTTKVTNAPSMFSGTFYFYGHVSPVASIPSNLFTGINLSSADNVYEMFYRSFDSFAYESTSQSNLNSIWGNANFAGRVTTENANSFWNSTFSNVTNLTGSAKSFIDAKLNGIIPSSPAHTFATTAINDISTIDANWR